MDADISDTSLIPLAQAKLEEIWHKNKLARLVRIMHEIAITEHKLNTLKEALIRQDEKPAMYFTDDIRKSLGMDTTVPDDV